MKRTTGLKIMILQCENLDRVKFENESAKRNEYKSNRPVVKPYLKPYLTYNFVITF